MVIGYMVVIYFGANPVITTPMTWIASPVAAVTLGAEIDFMDIDPETYTLDATQLDAALTPDTKSIIQVHLYGQCCDMDAILEIANRHNIPVLEDAAQAVGFVEWLEDGVCISYTVLESVVWIYYFFDSPKESGSLLTLY